MQENRTMGPFILNKLSVQKQCQSAHDWHVHDFIKNAGSLL